MWAAIAFVALGGLLASSSPNERSAPTPQKENAASATTCRETPTVREEPPKDPGATRFGFGPWQVNADRTIWAHAAHARHWTPGSYGNKVLWIRPKGTELEVAGRRLDAAAPPLTARIPCCYTKGFQATRLYFPTAGCWEVTATAGKNALTFITRVGPAAPPSAALITLPPARDDCVVRPAPPCKL